MSPAKKKVQFVPKPFNNRGVLLSVSVSQSVYLQLTERAAKAKIKETEYVRQALVFAMEHSAL